MGRHSERSLYPPTSVLSPVRPLRDLRRRRQVDGPPSRFRGRPHRRQPVEQSSREPAPHLSELRFAAADLQEPQPWQRPSLPPAAVRRRPVLLSPARSPPCPIAVGTAECPPQARVRIGFDFTSTQAISLPLVLGGMFARSAAELCKQIPWISVSAPAVGPRRTPELPVRPPGSSDVPTGMSDPLPGWGSGPGPRTSVIAGVARVPSAGIRVECCSPGFTPSVPTNHVAPVSTVPDRGNTRYRAEHENQPCEGGTVV